MSENGGFPSQAVVEGSVRPIGAPRASAADDGLSERQRAFVDAYVCGIPAEETLDGVEVRPGQGIAAAIAAGYAEVSARNMANRNLLNPKVQAEIEARVRAGRGSVLLAGVSALLEVVEKGQDERARVGAATALLDRFGMAPPKGPSVAVQINNTTVSASEASSVLTLIAEREKARLMRDSTRAPGHGSPHHPKQLDQL